MARQHSEEFKKSVVKKALLQPKSIQNISLELGIHRASIYNWIQVYGKGAGMSKKGKRPQDWNAAEKFKAVMDFSNMNEQAQGDFLRSSGLHSDHIEAWKKQMENSLDSSENITAKQSRAELSKLKAENKELKQDLNQKDKALASVTALLVLKKKANLIWGTGEDE